jgi:antitoxin ParD1/3/4
MDVSLTQELQKLVTEKVSSGMYQDTDEVIREALRLLQQRDSHLQQLRTEVHAGFAEIQRGNFSEHDNRSSRALINSIKKRGRKNLRPTKSTNR